MADATLPRSADPASDPLTRVRACLGSVIRGKSEAIDLLLVGLLSGGHVLVEDVPGVGKTTLAKALARALSMAFTRIQFTPDLLPTDILGSNVLDPRDGSFSFQPGPIFANLVLADEINRASPRTQSALLEAMNEGQVTVDGQTRALTAPFFVVATQNPVDYQGTYPLPEAQLDRFTVRMDLGYPPEDEELEILFARRLADPLEAVEPVLDTAGLVALQREVRDVQVRRDVGIYLLQLVRRTRAHADLDLGVSPRGALAFFRAVQARAYLAGRDFVSPEDAQALAGPVLEHRLQLTPKARYGGRTCGQVIDNIVADVAVPT